MPRAVSPPSVASSPFLRPAGGRTMTIRTRGVPQAKLEPAGLFVASGRRVAFTPMAAILRRLG